MRRVVSVWLPTWPTDRLRRTPGAPLPGRPVIVAAQDGSRRLVAAADAAARRLGIRLGITVALAQATTPGLTVVDADPEGDAAGLVRLAAWALRYSPVAAADPPDGLVIDVAGAAHLLGGEAALLDDLTGRLGRGGVAAQVAVADTWAAASGLARFAPGTIAPPGGVALAIAGLPVAALRLRVETIAALRGLGFDTVGELEAAPRASLAFRFGSELTERLDRAYGRADEVIEPVLAPSLPQAWQAFAEPLGHAHGLAMALARLASRLCADLEAAGLGARRLDLRVHRVDGQTASLRVGASRATRDPAHIALLFGERLGTVDPGFGIEAAVLVATRTEPLGARQLTLRPDEDGAEPDLGTLIDRIAGRIGARRIYRLTPVESDVPERGLRAVPALAPPAGRSWDAEPRPQRLFDPPQPIEAVALLPDHPPALFVWNGRRHRVVRADGPECVHGEWWLSDAEAHYVRDYFRVEDEDGQRLWLFRTTSAAGARWFIQGVFA